jgi:phosphoglycerate dehydrogenase-like enzyme
MIRVAVIDDWQNVASSSTDWSALQAVADVRFYTESLGDAHQIARELAPYDIIQAMRERTAFSATLLEQLPNLRLLALTGMSLRHIDTDFCNAQGIVCSGTSGFAPATTAELTLGLMLAAARHIVTADVAMRAGGFQESVPLGITLQGRTLGIVGVGRIGAPVAAYGRALGMRVLGWSRHLDDERARVAGVVPASKEQLLRESDVVSLHVPYSPRSHHLLGTAELALLRPGAILVNTSRGPLIDETALLMALESRRIFAALDVFDREPLPTDHPLRRAPNTVLTPHIGFGTHTTMQGFYSQSVENILGFLRRAPLRVLNPDSLTRARWAQMGVAR